MHTSLRSFGSRGSQVRILSPRQLKNKQLHMSVAAFFMPFFVSHLQHAVFYLKNVKKLTFNHTIDSSFSVIF